jgi:hypothetical protein
MTWFPFWGSKCGEIDLLPGSTFFTLGGICGGPRAIFEGAFCSGEDVAGRPKCFEIKLHGSAGGCELEAEPGASLEEYLPL